MSELPIELQLRELAGAVRWPATPDLAELVVARIEADAPGAPRRPPRGPRRARLAFALGQRRTRAVAALAALLVTGAIVEPVRSAVFDVLGIAGRERVIRVPGPPDTSRPALDLGTPVTLAQARARVGFVIGVPRAFGAPREVRYSDAIAGGAVTLVYPEAALLEFEGGPDPVLMKRVGAAAQVRAVTVAGEQGLYVTGVRELDILDRDGHVVQARRSLARADALVWQRGGVGYRLETRAGLRRALAIARSLR
jgi:hypothetical protein